MRASQHTWRWWVSGAMGAALLGLNLTGKTEAPLRFQPDSVQQPEWGARLMTERDREVERARIAAHLARVEAELRATDVTALPVARRAARARNLDLLRAYRERGIFPHNHVVLDHRTPVFVDEHGTQCAVGYLIARSGRSDLTRRIARARNLATIAQLADDAELKRWLAEAGLSPVEAAMIQPQYGPDYDSSASDVDAYPLATIIATGINGGLFAWNLTAAPDARLPGVLATTCGVAQAGLGLVASAVNDGQEIETAQIVANVVVGTATLVLGMWNLHRNAETQQPQPNGVAGAAAPKRSAWSVSPWWRGPDAGARVALRY
jgi:hypothetical protein